jgi:hypothetical protein
MIVIRALSGALGTIDGAHARACVVGLAVGGGIACSHPATRTTQIANNADRRMP